MKDDHPATAPVAPVEPRDSSGWKESRMEAQLLGDPQRVPSVVPALHETPAFRPGDRVRVMQRFPIGHYRVPLYLRGKTGVIERLVKPAIDNEEEGFGLNAGEKRYYYRIAFSMPEIWADYAGARQDRLCIEVFETWLEVAHNA